MARRLGVDVDPVRGGRVHRHQGARRRPARSGCTCAARAATRCCTRPISYPTYAMGATLAGCRAVPVPVDDRLPHRPRRHRPGRRRSGPVPVGQHAGQPGRRARRPGRGRGLGPGPRRARVQRRVLRRVHLGRPAPDDPRARHRRAWSPSTRCRSARTWPGPGPASTPATPTWSHYLSEVRKHAGFMVPGPVQAAAVAAWGDDEHVDAPARRYRAPARAAAATCSRPWGVDVAAARGRRSTCGCRRPTATPGASPAGWPPRPACWPARASSTARPAPATSAWPWCARRTQLDLVARRLGLRLIAARSPDPADPIRRPGGIGPPRCVTMTGMAPSARAVDEQPVRRRVAAARPGVGPGRRSRPVAGRQATRPRPATGSPASIIVVGAVAARGLVRRPGIGDLFGGGRRPTPGSRCPARSRRRSTPATTRCSPSTPGPSSDVNGVFRVGDVTVTDSVGRTDPGAARRSPRRPTPGTATRAGPSPSSPRRRPGTYTIAASRAADPVVDRRVRVAVGRGLQPSAIVPLFGAAGLGGLAVLVGIVLIVVTAVRRGRAKRRAVTRSPAVTPGAHPGGYPGGYPGRARRPTASGALRRRTGPWGAPSWPARRSRRRPASRASPSPAAVRPTRPLPAGPVPARSPPSRHRRPRGPTAPVDRRRRQAPDDARRSCRRAGGSRPPVGPPGPARPRPRPTPTRPEPTPAGRRRPVISAPLVADLSQPAAGRRPSPRDGRCRPDRSRSSASPSIVVRRSSGWRPGASSCRRSASPAIRCPTATARSRSTGPAPTSSTSSSRARAARCCRRRSTSAWPR